MVVHFDRHLGTRSMHAPPPRNGRYPFAVNDPALQEVCVFHGHSLSAGLSALLPGSEIREAVLLRDPVGYFLSMYNFLRRLEEEGAGPRRPPFATWYRAERKNPISRFLMQRYFGVSAPAIYRFSSQSRLKWLEERLARFWFVGSYADVDLLTDRVADEVGVPGSPERQNRDTVRAVSRGELPAGMVAEIERDNVVDAALFARWKSRRFDPARNPGPLQRALPAGDQIAGLWSEVDLGIRKKWLRWIQGYNRAGG